MSFAGYIRVSQTRGRSGDSFISPDVQRERIEAFAASKGFDVVCEPPELDVSGSKLVRPVLESILERIEHGECEGIIVATVDRLSRAGVGDALKLVERILANGGKVGFVELDIDPATASGEMALTMWLSVARMMWRKYQEQWATAQERGIQRGALPAATPLGYARREDGSLVVDDHDAELVRRAFCISAGQVLDFEDELPDETGLHAALSFLEAHFPERSWNVSVVQRLFRNPVYRGEVKHGTNVARFTALELVPRWLFDAAQHERSVTRRTRLLPGFPLAHIAECGSCGRPLIAQLQGKAKTRRLRCINQACTARVHVSADALEGYVLDAVRAAPPSADVGELARRHFALDNAGQALEDHLAQPEDDGAPEWRIKAWDEELKRLEAELLVARAESQQPTSLDLPDLTDPSLADMRVIFESAVTRLVVVPGTRGAHRPVSERVGTLELRS
jgi:DNA invertase Pin-like site-specific DNA recombinase